MDAPSRDPWTKATLTPRRTGRLPKRHNSESASFSPPAALDSCNTCSWKDFARRTGWLLVRPDSHTRTMWYRPRARCLNAKRSSFQVKSSIARQLGRWLAGRGFTKIRTKRRRSNLPPAPTNEESHFQGGGVDSRSPSVHDRKATVL